MREALAALTTRGRAFLAAGVTCLVCSVVLGQKDLLRIGVLVLLLPLITVVMVGRARYRLSCQRSIEPSRVPAGQPAQVTLTLHNTGRMPSSALMLEDQVPYMLGARPRFVVDQMGPRWHRDVGYAIRSAVRGRFVVGPLSVRVADPFGLIELTRSFTAQSTLVVTPRVEPLPGGGLDGEWSGSGDNRPRAFAAAGTEDVTVREYHDGDDLRRVHWPSSARLGELMVRREEQPWQARASLVVDTRAAAHRGRGPGSSFEWMVTAAASVGVHLSRSGYALRLVSETGDDSSGHWHDRGSGSVGDTEDLLDELAVVQPSDRQSLLLPPSRDDQRGVVVAVAGALDAAAVAALRRMAQGAGAGYALIADVSRWLPDDAPGHATVAEQVRRAVAELRGHGWRVAVAGPGDRIGPLWAQLQRGSPAPLPADELRVAALNSEGVHR
ncbi:MAG: DUF58 domain-containing protein [Actinomycetota bacterium]|nr:DUF58 domain-containing protein [Actinomycetota bacterium]